MLFLQKKSYVLTTPTVLLIMISSAAVDLTQQQKNHAKEIVFLSISFHTECSPVVTATQA